jgi:hypothetical protein
MGVLGIVHGILLISYVEIEYVELGVSLHCLFDIISLDLRACSVIVQ